MHQAYFSKQTPTEEFLVQFRGYLESCSPLTDPDKSHCDSGLICLLTPVITFMSFLFRHGFHRSKSPVLLVTESDLLGPLEVPHEP